MGNIKYTYRLGGKATLQWSSQSERYLVEINRFYNDQFSRKDKWYVTLNIFVIVTLGMKKYILKKIALCIFIFKKIEDCVKIKLF